MTPVSPDFAAIEEVCKAPSALDRSHRDEFLKARPEGRCGGRKTTTFSGCRHAKPESQREHIRSVANPRNQDNNLFWFPPAYHPFWPIFVLIVLHSGIRESPMNSVVDRAVSRLNSPLPIAHS